jgi:hypothetical protein
MHRGDEKYVLYKYSVGNLGRSGPRLGDNIEMDIKEI